jgi:hypothetical protein
MATEAGTQHGPDYPRQKANGVWVFDIYPNGVKKEIGDFPDEETAVAKWHAALKIWEANGSRYGGPINSTID